MPYAFFLVENKNESALFYIEAEKINSYRLDKDFKLFQQYKTSIDKRNTAQLMGSSISDSKYTLVFAQKNLNTFYSKTIDFDQRDDSEKLLIALDKKKEKLLFSISEILKVHDNQIVVSESYLKNGKVIESKF